MSIVIEDGSGVEGADSYVTVQAAKDYAASRGVTLPATDGAIEILLRQACDYLDTLEAQYKGSRTDPEQPLAWPRTGVDLFGTELADDAIPSQLTRAQCQLACDAATGLDLMPNGAGREVTRQKVDVIETEYAKTGSGSVLPELNRATAILQPLMSSGGISLRTVRV